MKMSYLEYFFQLGISPGFSSLFNYSKCHFSSLFTGTTATIDYCEVEYIIVILAILLISSFAFGYVYC